MYNSARPLQFGETDKMPCEQRGQSDLIRQRVERRRSFHVAGDI